MTFDMSSRTRESAAMLSLLLLLCLSLLFCPCAAENKGHSGNETAVEGRSVQFASEGKNDDSVHECTITMPDNVILYPDAYTCTDDVCTLDDADDPPDNPVDTSIREGDWTFSFYETTGADCGIELLKVDRRDDGMWRWDNDQDYGYYYVIVQVEPTAVRFKDDEEELEVTYQEGEGVEIVCFVENVQPEPEVTLDFGSSWSGEPNATLASFEYPADSDDGYDELQLAYKAVFDYYAMPGDHGKSLVCRAEHVTLAQDMVSEPMNITVKAPPDELGATETVDDAKIGEDATLTVSFTSYPEPTVATWTLPGGTRLDASPADDAVANKANNDELSSSSGRYSASPLSSTGSDQYRAVLTVEEVEEDDEGESFTLTVYNSEGHSNFTVTLRDIEDDGLSGGAIAGIVVGSVAFVVLVVLAVYFILKYRKQKKARRSQQERLERARAHAYYEQQQVGEEETRETTATGAGEATVQVTAMRRKASTEC